MNPLSGILGALSLVLYTLLYTPLKRVTPFAVFVGAIPGAMPPLLGWVAARNEIGFEAILLYTIQFIYISLIFGLSPGFLMMTTKRQALR